MSFPSFLAAITSFSAIFMAVRFTLFLPWKHFRVSDVSVDDVSYLAGTSSIASFVH